MMTFALIPAGGKSQRMGRPKLALPLGERSILGHVIAALREAEIEHVLVVLGPHVSSLLPLAEAAGAQTLLLVEETPDMRTTVEHGLRWLEERFHPEASDSWLLAPADQPTLAASVVRQLIEAYQSNPACSIAVPTFQGKRGHPVLIGWKHVAGIKALPAGEGINVYLRKQEAETLAVPVESADILCDLDTPEDYERLCKRWKN